MPLTTGGPPPVGVYWHAAIYASATISTAAQYAGRTIPLAHANITAKARYGALPPQACALRVSAKYRVEAGTEGNAESVITARAFYQPNRIPSAAATITVHVSYTDTGAKVLPRKPQHQINVAVTRAATI